MFAIPAPTTTKAMIPIHYFHQLINDLPTWQLNTPSSSTDDSGQPDSAFSFHCQLTITGNSDAQQKIMTKLKYAYVQNDKFEILLLYNITILLNYAYAYSTGICGKYDAIKYQTKLATICLRSLT